MHKLAISAAALAVCVLPTACDFPLASPPGAPTAPSGDGSGNGGIDTTAPVVVPVGNTTANGYHGGDHNRPPRTRTRTTRTRSTTTTAPVTTTTTDPATVPAGNPPVDTSVPTDTGTAVPTDTGTAVPPIDTTVPVTTTAPPATTTTVVTPTNGPVNGNNGLEVLGRDCANSGLPPHSGFQDLAASCVSTAMGEVAAQDKLPSLLITAAPQKVGVGQPFMLEVSTRNLIRNRFLGAAAGGYYLESSFLDKDTGLQRGHFHTACRMLPSTTEAPDSSGVPAFFLATQDNGGGAKPDTVTIAVPATATATAGTMQCTSWAGDGSHRTPMMSKANQTPAIDSVRITVGGDAPAVQNNVNGADAQADAQKQAAAQTAEAVPQKPDQDGAPQPGGEQNGVPNAPGAPGASPDTAAPATPAADSSTTTSAPAAGQSLQERFKEAQKETSAANGG